MTDPAAPRRRPPALRHGLTSRLAREARSADVEALAAALLEGTPREASALEAARDAAEAILHLRSVQWHRRQALEAAARAGGPCTELEGEEVRAAANILCAGSRVIRDARRFSDYERRGFSRRRRALRKLDYERIEAERRRGDSHDQRGRPPSP